MYLVFLAGCAGYAEPFGGTPGTAASGGASRSWMLPGARSSDLLYVTFFDSNDVFVFSYPKAKLVGVLGDMRGAMCPGEGGRVWITQHKNKSVAEYEHGSAQLVALFRTRFSPGGCATDPSSGDLAVGIPPDKIAIYKHAAGSPKKYAVSNGGALAYDGDGDLFTVTPGATQSAPPVLSELERGSITGREVSFISGRYPSFYPTPVQWDGRYITVAGVVDIDRYVVKNYTATLKGITKFRDIHELADSWISGSTVVVVNMFGMGSVPAVQIDKYPAGGEPIRIVDLKGFETGSVVQVMVSLDR